MFELNTAKGVCAPVGFKAAGVHCGIRPTQTKLDLGAIVSDVMCVASAVYTQNKVFGAPITVTRNNLRDNQAQAVICNSGIANTCAADGIETAQEMCKLIANVAGISEEDVIVASTGVIGQSLPMDNIRNAMPELKSKLSYDGGHDFVKSIMTTDTFPKEVSCSFELDGKTCSIGAVAKGSGMIHPNMATLLSFITTDVNITSDLLDKALKKVVSNTLNMLSVDGDTSTNDTTSIMANGLAKNSLIDSEDENYNIFCDALEQIMLYLTKQLAKDGEGATKTLEVKVSSALNDMTAKTLAKSVITSSLVKTAMFGSDANWGRILCALGYADAEFDANKVEVIFESEAGSIVVCENGAGINFDEDIAKNILDKDYIYININLYQGQGTATAWGCDLTYDYVKINGDYRS